MPNISLQFVGFPMPFPAQSIFSLQATDKFSSFCTGALYFISCFLSTRSYETSGSIKKHQTHFSSIFLSKYRIFLSCIYSECRGGWERVHWGLNEGSLSSTPSNPLSTLIQPPVKRLYPEKQSYIQWILLKTKKDETNSFIFFLITENNHLVFLKSSTTVFVTSVW